MNTSQNQFIAYFINYLEFIAQSSIVYTVTVYMRYALRVTPPPSPSITHLTLPYISAKLSSLYKILNENSVIFKDILHIFMFKDWDSVRYLLIFQSIQQKTMFFLILLQNTGTIDNRKYRFQKIIFQRINCQLIHTHLGSEAFCYYA